MKKLYAFIIGYFIIHAFSSNIFYIALDEIFEINGIETIFMPQNIKVGLILLFLELATLIVYSLVFSRFFGRMLDSDGIFKFKTKLFLLGGTTSLLFLILSTSILYFFKTINFSIGETTISYLITGLIGTVVISVKEEFVFRVVLLGTLSENYGKLLGVLISSIVFSLVHIINKDISIVPLVEIFIISLLISVLYIAYKNFWLVVGFHTIYNWFLLFIINPEPIGQISNTLFKTQIIVSENQFQIINITISLILITCLLSYFLWQFKPFTKKHNNLRNAS